MWRKKPFKRGRKPGVLLQLLEQRALFSAVAQMHPTFVLDVTPSPLAPPFTPAQIRQAYGINSITANGAGQTIAIIDAFNDPNIITDENTFNTTYGLQQFNVPGGPTFKVENQNGLTVNLPPNAAPGNWDLEESLDVEWAHAIAPRANIILFEANSDSSDDLYAAVNTARSTRDSANISVISMSWGGPEDPSDLGQDSLFTTPAGHTGITFISSTGDSGEPGGYPAYSPNVLAAGGTSLTINGDGSYGGETGWANGGGGISQYESQPDYQSAKVSAINNTQRTIPDVSWLADPNTGVNVLDTYADPSDGWMQIGGTSLATPMWGGMISMINQGRAARGLPTLDGPSQTLPMLYDLPSSDFNDITSGNNGFAAGVGYDLVTGLGAPSVSNLYNNMVAESTIYVDASAPGSNNGSSWVNAYTTLSQALANATGNDEILVSQGTYYPTNIADPTAMFNLQDNVAIYGGFGGYSATNPNAQDSSLYPTILSGRVGPSVNSYHVVSASGTNATAILDGVTIEDGDSLSISGFGGGMYNASGSPTITNCTFTNNQAGSGGAIYDSAASPTLVNCMFNGNNASNDGGAIDDENGSAVSLIHCTFNNDTAVFGGALYESSSNSTIKGCTFTQNKGSSDGGAIDTTDSASPLIIDSVLDDNSSPYGGATGSDGASMPQLINCLLANNSGVAAVFGNGAVMTLVNCTIAGSNQSALLVYSSGSAELANCIVWDNTYSITLFSFTGSVSAAVSYSDIQGGYSGTGNINADPQFVRAPRTNGPADNGDLHLRLTSPAIDDGNNSAVPANITTDLDGRPRFVDLPGVNDPGAIVDMGVYEAWQNLVFVDTRATGHNDGSSWANAFTALAAALVYAQPDQTIEVAAGTYYPTDTGDRTATFQLISNVTIEGGFAGVGAGNPDARDPMNTPSILSGDIGAAGDSSDNSYHVVTASYTNFTSVLDGFTITGGNADSTVGENFIGGGMLNDGGSPTINDCTFTNNTAIVFGGAVLNELNGDPTFTNCSFTDNTVGNSIYNAFGGAIGNYGANPFLLDCTFIGNSANSPSLQAIGGAIENEFSTPTLIGCVFKQNFTTGSQGGFGGAMDSQSTSSPTVINCTFEGNWTNLAGGAVMNIGVIPTFSNCVFVGNAAPVGGAMYNFQSGSPNIINCTFADNLAQIGGAMTNDTTSTPVITNSIMWGDRALMKDDEIYLATGDSNAIITNSDIDGGWAGPGNINTDPQFLRSPDPGTDLTWGTADDSYGNLAPGPNSPAIDEGSNAAVRSGVTTDISNSPRFVDIPGIHDPGAIVDLGAFERQLLNALSISLNNNQQVVVQFSEDVSASIAASDLQLISTLTGASITASTLSYNSGSKTATFGFSSPLPGGIEQVQLNNSGVTDSFGNSLSPTYNFSFLYIPANQSLVLPAGSQVYTVQQLAISSGATLDIGNDELIVQYTPGISPAGTIQSLITSGANNGNWNGTGIVSSDVTVATSVGYFDDNSEVTIRRTWKGDANLDGLVGADDLSLLMLGQALSLTSWQFGNFNYTAKIDADDWMAFNVGNAFSAGQSIQTTFPSAVSSANNIVSTPAPLPSNIFADTNIAAILHSFDPSITSVANLMPSLLGA